MDAQGKQGNAPARTLGNCESQRVQRPGARRRDRSRGTTSQYRRVLQLGASAPGMDGLEWRRTLRVHSRAITNHAHAHEESVSVFMSPRALGCMADGDIKHQAPSIDAAAVHVRRRWGPLAGVGRGAAGAGAGACNWLSWQDRCADVQCIAGLAARGGRALGSESECNKERDGRDGRDG